MEVKRSRINPVSRKRRAENAVRAELRRELLDSKSPWCERCREREWTDMHEILPRSRGGSITDPENIALLDRQCHEWVTTHPRLATQEGWLKSRWGKHEGSAR